MKTYADKKHNNKSRSAAIGSVSSTPSQVSRSHGSLFQLKHIGFVDNRPEAKRIAQLQAMTNQHTLQKQLSIQRQSTPSLSRPKNDTGLPDHLKSSIENLSGNAMDDVKVHYNSEKPAQLHAHAYAQGTDIHVGPGQEKHLPHEAWHVVQQKQGRVKPTRQLKNRVSINDDARLEKEADIMGNKAMQLKSFEIDKAGSSSPFQEHTNTTPVAQLITDNDVREHFNFSLLAFHWDNFLDENMEFIREYWTYLERYDNCPKISVFFNDLFNKLICEEVEKKDWAAYLIKAHPLQGKLIPTIEEIQADEDQYLQGKEQEVDWENNLAETGAEQQLGDSTNTRPTKKEVAHLTMGQGLVVNMEEYILTSTEFSSCSPVAMFNENTNLGGLFHFPANAFDEGARNFDLVQTALVAMLDKINPTIVIINSQITNALTGETNDSDVNNLTQLFKGYSLNTSSIEASEFHIKLEDNDFTLNAGSPGKISRQAIKDRTGRERLLLAKAWADAPPASKYGKDLWS